VFWTKDAAKMPNLGILGVFLGGVLGVFPETGFFAGPKKEGGYYRTYSGSASKIGEISGKVHSAGGAVFGPK